jgi:tetratricopeptide (TPR) repeat protein
VAIDREKVQASAQKYVEKKKYDKAVAELQKIIAEHPDDARTLLKIGDLQSKMGEFANTIATYERVGKFYASQGFALKAIAVYKQIKDLVAKQVPHLEERYGHITPLLADLYQQLGLVSDALAALDEHATRLQRQQKDTEAIEVFRRIVELDTTNPLPHLRLAEALSRAHDVDGAISEFKDAADLLVKLGRRDDAIKVLERLIHLKSDPAIARRSAELYLERGMGQDGMLALAKLQICFQADPKNLDTLALLARAFGTIGQGAKGVEVQKEMARLAKEQGKGDLFKQLVDKLMRVAPNDEQVRALAMSSANMPAVAADAPIIRDAEATGPSKTGRSRGSGSFEEVSYDDIQASESLAPPPSSTAEEPFPLQQSDRPPPPSAPRHHDIPSHRPPSLTNLQAPRPSNHEDSYGAAPDVLVDDAQPMSEGTSTDELREAIAQLMADASSFRRVRLYAKAIETLRTALELDVNSRAVHETLRDVLLEARRYQEATEEMVILAGLQMSTGDVEGAIRSLYDVLALDPSHGRATEMLEGLGVNLEAPASETTDVAAAGDAYDADAPLPSYDFEDGEAATRAVSKGALAADEPFGSDSPLPSFPLAPESETSFDLVQARGSAPPPEAVPSSRTPGELEEALEEADFFASRGLYDDARAILHEQLTLHPNHMLLQERLTELDSQEQGARGGSGTREVPRGSSGPVDRSFDIAASLDAIENLDTVNGMPVGIDETTKQIDVEEVFAKFKEGVAAQVSADDTQSHYDLGVAYREMGLFEDAIREFDVAAADPKRECVCRSMIGMTLNELGRTSEAIEAFLQGLHSSTRTPEQETVLCYEIGAANESLRRTKDALTYFQKVMRRDSSYRDVQERVRRLTKADAKPAPRAAAVGADDEFDRAFDEIIGGGKLP